MRRGTGSLWIAAAAAAVLGCGNESGTFEPVGVGGDVVIKVVGVVVSEADQTPLDDVSVWVDIGTEEGGEPRATDRSNAEGRFTMVFTESDCSLATEMAYRVFARKKGFSDGELTRDGNGGLPVLKCVTREQVIGFQLEPL
jgi:hypothetical protein